MRLLLETVFNELEEWAFISKYGQSLGRFLYVLKNNWYFFVIGIIVLMIIVDAIKKSNGTNNNLGDEQQKSEENKEIKEIRCNNCHTFNDSNNQYCCKCGAKLIMYPTEKNNICPCCKKTNLDSNDYCTYCGTKLEWWVL